MKEMKELKYRFDPARRVALAAIDTPGPVNVIGAQLVSDLGKLAGRAMADGARGIVLTSPKPRSFLDGANLAEIVRDPSPEDLRHLVAKLQSALSSLARAPIPVVAVVRGQTALGGGCELLLWACDRVFATAGARLGLPEVNVGLFPAAGGFEALRRLVGLGPALEIVMEGKVLPAESWVKMGLVSMVEGGDPVEASLDWIDSHQGIVNRNLDPSWREPGVVSPEESGRILAQARTRFTVCPHRPWLRAALDALERGLDLPFEQAACASADLFAPLIVDPNSRNKIDLFFNVTSVGPRLARIDETRAVKAERLAVIGSGLMGRGIAQVCADAGLKVLLYDVDEAAASAGKDRIGKSLDPLVAKGRWLPERRARALENIEPTADWGLLSGVPLVVESVFEKLALKQEILRRVQTVNPGAVFASNTSTLPMAEIAAGALRPEQVVGMHYFSPVPLMPLLEVVRGPMTSPAALATAVVSGRKQGKTCIVVGDGPGFYTSRGFGVYVMTGFFLAEMGLDPWEVDGLAREAGFPQGPFDVYGTAGGSIIWHAAMAMRERMGDRLPVPGSLARMVEAGYVGAGKPCFYKDGKQPDRSALDHMERRTGVRPPGADEASRMLILSMVGEAFRCMDDGVLEDFYTMDLGAALGIGFPDCWHGPARWVSLHGVRETRDMLHDLHAKHGIAWFEPAREFDRLLACGVTRSLI